MEIAVFCLFCGIATAVLASAKNRSGWKWLVFGLLLGPFALIAIGFMPKVEPHQQDQPSSSSSPDP